VEFVVNKGEELGEAFSKHFRSSANHSTVSFIIIHHNPGLVQ
jgi:hypothetical protein